MTQSYFEFFLTVQNLILFGRNSPSGSSLPRIYGTPKMYKFSFSDSFLKLRPIVLSIGTFNYNFALFL